eukprot:gene38535-46840_t
MIQPESSPGRTGSMNKLKKFLKQASRTVLSVVVAVSVFFVVFQVREVLLSYANGLVDESPHVANAAFQTAVGHILMFTVDSRSDPKGLQSRFLSYNSQYCDQHNYTWLSNIEPRIPSTKQNSSPSSTTKALDTVAGLMTGSLHTGKSAEWIAFISPNAFISEQKLPLSVFVHLAQVSGAACVLIAQDHLDSLHAGFWMIRNSSSLWTHNFLAGWRKQAELYDGDLALMNQVLQYTSSLLGKPLNSSTPPACASAACFQQQMGRLGFPHGRRRHIGPLCLLPITRQVSLRMHVPGEYKTGDLVRDEPRDAKPSNVLSYDEHYGTVYWKDAVHYQFPRTPQ